MRSRIATIVLGMTFVARGGASAGEYAPGPAVARPHHFESDSCVSATRYVVARSIAMRTRPVAADDQDAAITPEVSLGRGTAVLRRVIKTLLLPYMRLYH